MRRMRPDVALTARNGKPMGDCDGRGCNASSMVIMAAPACAMRVGRALKWRLGGQRESSKRRREKEKGE